MLYDSGDAGDQRQYGQATLHQNYLRIACNTSIKSNCHNVRHQADKRRFTGKCKYCEQYQYRKKAVVYALILEQNIHILLAELIRRHSEYF